ncbi:MAG: cytochrome c oxidase assembly protein, partial [Caldilineaceae bacterium]
FGARIAMLVGAEIPNVVAGITIAFGSVSVYSFYEVPMSTIAPVLTQQSMAGALTWVFGSIVYISAIVAVVNQAFQSEGSGAPQPPHNWDATEKWIAPGLEARVREADYRPHDWREL